MNGFITPMLMVANYSLPWELQLSALKQKLIQRSAVVRFINGIALKMFSPQINDSLDLPVEVVQSDCQIVVKEYANT